jgi:hypothetical protein
MYQFRGQISNPLFSGNKIWYTAPKSPDFRDSYHGSGLPFYGKEMAFFNSPNKGSTNISENGQFIINLKQIPGSYYDEIGNLIPPRLHIRYLLQDGSYGYDTFNITNAIINNRSTRKEPFFHPTSKWIMSQQNILKQNSIK